MAYSLASLEWNLGRPYLQKILCVRMCRSLNKEFQKNWITHKYSGIQNYLIAYPNYIHVAVQYTCVHVQCTWLHLLLMIRIQSLGVRERDYDHQILP